MPWSTLASNQTVTFNNLQDAVNTGVFTAKTSIPASNECITKADANTYVNIDTSSGSYASKASNQLVYKADLVAPATGVIYTPSSGIYPLSGSSSVSSSGTIRNNFSYTVYINIVFNSAGLSSGTVNNDNAIITPLSAITISGQSFNGTGQLVFSGSRYTLNANTTYNISITKGDLLGGGSTLRFYYSTSPVGGPYIPI